MDLISWVSIISLFFSILLGAFYLFLKHRYQFWKNKGVKYVQPSFPFGNVKDIAFFRKTIGHVYEDLYYELEGEKFGGIYALHLPQILIRDPELIKTFLVKDFSHFHDRGFPFDATVDPISENLFVMNGEKWKDLRNKLSPTFTSGKMKMMFQVVEDCGMELKDYMGKLAEEEDIFEAKDVMAKFTTDVISSCAFGIKCNCIKNPEAEFRKWGRRIFEANFTDLLRNFLLLMMPEVGIALKIPSTPRDVANFFTTMVNETVGYREKHSVMRKDFLQLLIQLKNNGYIEKNADVEQINRKLTMNEVAAQAFVFFVAGFETSSITTSHALYELAVNPDIQERLQVEIDGVLQKHDGKISYEAIQEMHFLDKVVSETLRKHPPVAFLQRECTKEYHIPGTDVVLDEGVRVIIPIEALHYDAKYFPNPQRFDPERFNEENSKNRHHYVYLPFGEGPRVCIGMRFALMQSKVGLVSLLSDYEFIVCNKTAIPLVKDPKQFTNTAMGGIWLKVKRRTNKSQ